MIKKSFLKVLGLLMLSVLAGCSKNDVDEENPNQYVNDWIYSSLKEIYYWEDKIPESSDKTLSPDKYFESVIYKYDNVTAPDGDRFSWIQDNWKELLSSLSGVSANEIGFDYVLYLKESGSDLVIGQITYVKKGTPAEAAGLKRGWWFESINGTKLTTSNYSSLLSVTDTHVKIGFSLESYDAAGTFAGFVKGSEYDIQTLSNYAEDPIYLDSIYTINSSKIGYLVYNFFAPDNGSGDYSYDLELNDIFGKFKSAGITDLVLDLRYNSGGYTESCQYLGSMIVPDLKETNVFTYYRYNEAVTDYYSNKYGEDFFNTYFTASIKSSGLSLAGINNVGSSLSRLYVLTGPYTASASEQLINGLKPYMDVILIGDTTYGKNVASSPIYEEDDPNNTWGMEPIIAKFFNSKGESDFTAGFTPDFGQDETGIGVKQLGDTQEILLNIALANASGLTSSTRSAIPKDPYRDGDLKINNVYRVRGAQLKHVPILK